MALLLGAQSLAKAYGAGPLFRNLSLAVHEGDRLGVVGPNGCGKSTLLKVLAGLEEPDEGVVAPRRLLRRAWVAQHPCFAEGRSVRQVLDDALAGVEHDESVRAMRVGAMIGRCGFADGDALPANLSGGWQKRLAIAAGLLGDPDVLLLDEPTNHLDVDGILWLEEILQGHPGAIVVVSHDRWFLENVATRMLDLDPVHQGGFFETTGRYSDFLERKEAALLEQQRWQSTLANQVRREVEWLRRGPKARTTKSRSRIDGAARLQEDLAEVGARLDRRVAGIGMTASDRRTRRLLVCEGVSRRYEGREVLRSVDLVLAPGVRLGLLGPNGSGKSTLIRILTGEDSPDGGKVERAEDLRIALLDQHRTSLDRSLTLRRALAPAGDQVVFAGRPIHVAAWAKRFLFRPEQLSMPVDRLSGGEQARVLLAGLMLQPADVLVLDEPTNDLDIPTLEALEEALLEFPGAVVLVTHDRYLFQRVVTTVLGLDGRGGAIAYADYAQWEAERPEARPDEAPRGANAAAGQGANEASPQGGRDSRAAAPGPDSAAADAATRANAASAKPRKLGYREQQEWDAMEGRILAAEEALAEAEARAADPSIVSNAAEVTARCAALEEARVQVESLYARWAELEALQKPAR